ncbi:MAG: L-fucose/L-arabinose isomerase family protein [Candidatus Omnitrophica bacterium]|nr:L-fucose/L-arabinose isomerase family protein [Candidatus Omnitrophota bacterium]
MKIQSMKSITANVGVFGVGLDTYWEQFDGLYDYMRKKQDVFLRKLQKYPVYVKDFGIIDNAQKAYAALPAIKAANLDLLFVDMLTYATSSTFGIIVRELEIPIVLVALQPLPAMDYEKASTYMQLCNDDLCAVPEFTGVAVRMGKPVSSIILGMLENDPAADAEIAEWCTIACVINSLKYSRIGLLGHVLEAMLDMHTDPTAVTAAFGCHVVQCEAEDVMKYFRILKPDDPEVANMKNRILSFFDTPEPVSDPVTMKLTETDLDTAARASMALEKFIKEKGLDGLAYYYEAEEGSEMRKLLSNFIVGNSLLISAGFPMCGEYDLKTCIAMMIMERLGCGGSFAEFHPIDFTRDSVLVGHDGPHHLNLSNGKPVLRSLKKYHGKPGFGASVEFNIKVGPITMLSIGVKADGKFKMIVAEGESITGPVPPTGNTNTHGKFQPDVRTFLKRWCAEGPTHHFALGAGHTAATVKKIGNILDIETVIV